MCVSLSLVVEESDATVITTSDEGGGCGRVGETMDGGQVTCTQENNRTHVYILHIVANDSRFFYLVCASKIFGASVLVS